MSQNNPSRPRLKFYAILAASILVAAGLGVAWAYFQSQQVPEFYQRAKARVAERGAGEITRPNSPDFDKGANSNAGSAQKLNALLTRLTGSGADHAGVDEWLAGLTGEPSTTRIHEVFGEDDINAWLTKELPGKFQHCLPPGVSEPQVEFSNGRGLVGFRYERGGLAGVVTLDVDVAMTGQGSQLGIRLRKISVGSLPLPIGQVLDLISDAGNRSQGPAYRGPEVVRWTQHDGDPVALLPGAGPGGGYFNRLESFSLRDGEVEVAIQRQPNQRR